MTTVREWFDEHELEHITLDDRFASQPWEPNEYDRKAAWALYTEMRTRVATQPLHFRSGDEVAALGSIYQLFDMSRRAMMTGANEGHRCRLFSNLATIILNQVVRPFTTKWHKRNIDGRLSYENDCHEFRLELKRLQKTLRPFQSALGAMAEEDEFTRGAESGFVATSVQTPSGAEQVLVDEEEIEAHDAEIKADKAAPWPATSWDRREKALHACHTDLPAKTFYTDDVPLETRQEIRLAEREEIIARREAVNEIRKRVEPDRPQLPIPEENQPLANLTGLAISGGGIRSATFSLGVIQRLAEQGLLSDFDYISTVSGGGYTGSFLSSYLDTPNPLVGLEAGNFPFRTGRPIESMAIRSIRNHGKYLIFGGLRKLQMFGLAILGVVTNLFVMSALVIICVIATKLAMGGELQKICEGVHPRLLGQPFPNVWLASAIASVGLAGMLSVIYSRGRDYPPDHPFSRFTRSYERATMLAFMALILITVINVIPVMAFYFHNNLYPDVSSVETLTKMDWAVLGAALVSFMSPLMGFIKTGRKWVIPIGMVLLGLSAPIVFLGSFFVLLERLVIQADPHQNAWVWLVLMLAGPLGYGVLLLNINFNSPHRFYRNRLSDAFLIKPPDEFPADYNHVKEDVQTNDGQKLSKLRAHRKEVPYHLINASINTPASKNTNLRGRNSDFFIFSQRYCGSALSGYHPTPAIERLDGHVDLGTAMSISAAAVAPQMGALPFTSAAFILTLLNVRLNYWLRNPKSSVISNWVARWLSQPNVFYLYREMFNFVDENARYVNLSDGGHLENLGVYELLRRRCKFIVAIEGEADPQMRCSSLMKLIRKSKIDLGVDVHFEIDDFQVQENGFSRSSFRVGVIDYGPRGDMDEAECIDGEDDSGKPRDMGVLVYLKNTMTGSESVTLKDYRLNNMPFPHQSTIDQYFDEEQFESFRSLGYHVSDEAMRAELFDGRTPNTLNVADWAQTLVQNVFSD